MSKGFGTTGVAFATAPVVVSTFVQHFVKWPARHKRARNAESTLDGPTSAATLQAQQLRYEEGLNLVRRFLEYASLHGVEEVQAFTAQPLPIPHWIHREVVVIPEDVIEKAANILTKHLASYGGEGKGVELVGGDKWWRVRGRELEAEWLEVTKAYNLRRSQTTTSMNSAKRRSWHHLTSLRRSKGILDASGGEVIGDRVILYIHGGAFFFSSLDMHRYQIQRHARKAGARAFVPNYRLSPQYPFPCGLLDSLAAYLYLISPPEGVDPIVPSNIVLMGDSAGGNMCLSLLILIREMGLPMPAAASLMSPWCDLTHSMPSIMGYDGGDYIPNVGFHYKPSVAWPPIPGDGISVTMPDGKERLLDEQIQLYCPNNLLTHPLVSPINAGSLGGLCPLYINCGLDELLRDEIVYVAYKAAHPTAYPPAETTLKEYPDQVPLIDKYPPTKVHFQQFERACHVATTLAWTRSAKHIFRGAANFNIWAFKAARKGTELREADNSGPKRSSTLAHPGELRMSDSRKPSRAQSLAPQSQPGTNPSSRAPSSIDLTQPAISSAAASLANQSPPPSSDYDSETSDTDSVSDSGDEKRPFSSALNQISVRGIEPSFGKRTIVAEHVSTHGRISHFQPVAEVAALDPAYRQKIGRIRGDGPVLTWLAKRADWDKRFAGPLKHWREVRTADRATAEKSGFLTGTLAGDRPPLGALAGFADRELARKVGASVDEPTTPVSAGVALWMKMGEHADQEAVKNQNLDRRSSVFAQAGRRASLMFGGRRGSDDKRSSSGSLASNGKRDSHPLARSSTPQSLEAEQHKEALRLERERSKAEARVTEVASSASPTSPTNGVGSSSPAGLDRPVAAGLTKLAIADHAAVPRSPLSPATPNTPGSASEGYETADDLGSSVGAVLGMTEQAHVMVPVQAGVPVRPLKSLARLENSTADGTASTPLVPAAFLAAAQAAAISSVRG